VYSTPTAGNLFITILIKMLHDKNQSGNAPTEGKEVTNFKNGSGLSRESLSNGFDYYSKIIENCRISEQTSKFLACIAMMLELYEHVHDAIEFAYGESQVDEILNRDYMGKWSEMETVLYCFVCLSISDGLADKTITEI
jgi:hypothetical protein